MTQLFSLPNEILTRIMAFTMASQVPVHLKIFVEMSRDPGSLDDRKDRTYSLAEKFVSSERPPILPDSPDPRERAAAGASRWLSQAWWLEKLPETQIEHHLDWICVNSTCHRLQNCGRIAFFREKAFIIEPLLLMDLRGSFANHINTALFPLLQQYVSKIIIPIQLSASTPWITLPKVHQVFRHLRTLYIYEHAVAEADSRSESRKPLTTEDPPLELQQLLQVLGLRLDHLTFKLMNVASPVHEKNDAWLDRSVYPLLRFMADRKQARKQVSK